MTQFSKFTLKTLAASPPLNPTESRRTKLLAAIEIQKLVLAAAIKGETYQRQTKKGERPVRAWFVSQDGGFYVQCKYGARPLLLDGAANAVFVAKLIDVGPALAAFEAATKAGELDQAIAAISKRAKA